MLRGSAAVTLLPWMMMVAAASAQTAQTPPAPPEPSRSPVELVGCVSDDPGASGSFTLDESGGSRYRLTGKSVRKYAGSMVRLVGGPHPAQASSARQPGGAASGTGGGNLPEFRVVSVRRIDGYCR